MAQKVQTLLVDDLDGSEAETTVRFGLDGSDYEIDLSTVHARELRDSLAVYAGHARRIPGTGRRPGPRKQGASEVNTSEVRDWAKAEGIEVKDRGRIPAEVVARYKAATGR
jgi:Lsr2